MHEKGGFADTRLPADQDQAAGHDPPSQHPVELVPREGGPWSRFGGYLPDRDSPGALRRAARFAPWAGLADLDLLQRVPGPAVRALAGPPDALAAAFRAHEGNRRFRHRG